MARLSLEQRVTDPKAYFRTVGRFRDATVRLPTFAELADPARVPDAIQKALSAIDPCVMWAYAGSSTTW